MSMRRVASVFSAAVALVLVTAASLEARVVRLVVEKRRPLAEGKSFGASGPYERVEGTAVFEIDPQDALNRVIVNIGKAPRNRAGRVEFSSPFVILKPLDAAKGNRKLLFGINNRGNAIEIPFHTLPSKGTNAPADEHDGLLFQLGYSFVDAGWAGDIVTTENRLGANLPVAIEPDGRPVVSRIRIEYQGTGFTLPLKGTPNFRSYETADTNTARSTLTVRDRAGTRTEVPRDRWAFGRCPTGQASLIPTTFDICVFDAMKDGRIYELTYPAKGPWVMGLAYAVTRDLASFLRNSAKDDAGNPNPMAVDGPNMGIRRVYGLGTSSTGMYLREFLYLGFNEDETHQKVFDAVRILIPGTHRLFANVEFSDPNVYSRQDQHTDYLSHSVAPFTYAVTTDPISGVRDGILKRPATDPLVFHVDSANEFWQMNASLNVHDGRGQPVPIPDNVRLYFVSSHAHVGGTGVGAMPTATNQCAFPVNGALSYNALLRALVVALDEWADKGVAPPPSRYPTVTAGTLVMRQEAEAAFPKIPGARFPGALNEVFAFDYGAGFTPKGGRVATVPKKGSMYTLRVPKPDADGLDLGGVRMLDVAVPVGTNTGWNLWAPGPKGQDLCGLSGAFFAFPKSTEDRERTGDPRRSLEERYSTHAGFVAAVEKAARELVTERFLLDDDAKTLVATAGASSILR